MSFLSKLLWWRKKEKPERPSENAIVKLTDSAKFSGIYEDELKIIEVHRNGKKTTIPYTESDVKSLQEQGIPVVEEEYSEKFDFIDSDIGGTLEYRR